MTGSRLLLLLICLPILAASILQAQETGQICALSYDDRNGNGSRDANEPLITQGIGATLLNDKGVTVQSRLLEDSLFAASGLLCFDQLLSGDYVVVLTSAEYSATTETSFAASVNPGTAPVRLDFGARPLQVEVVSSNVQSGLFDMDTDRALGIALGIIGSLITVLIVSVIGVLIYVLTFRRRLRKASAARIPSPAGTRTPAPPITGVPPQPAPTTQSANALRKLVPSGGSPLLFADDETDVPRVK